VRVWYSTAELRYLVLPERPVGSEKLSEEAFAALVTRDAMIGVAKVTLTQPGGSRIITRLNYIEEKYNPGGRELAANVDADYEKYEKLLSEV
jgi:hypothetical protein